MTTNDDRDGYFAGRLIQWGLRPKAIPFNEPEYRELIDRYIDRPASDAGSGNSTSSIPTITSLSRTGTSASSKRSLPATASTPRCSSTRSV